MPYTGPRMPLQMIQDIFSKVLNTRSSGNKQNAGQFVQDGSRSMFWIDKDGKRIDITAKTKKYRDVQYIYTNEMELAHIPTFIYSLDIEGVISHPGEDTRTLEGRKIIFVSKLKTSKGVKVGVVYDY